MVEMLLPVVVVVVVDFVEERVSKVRERCWVDSWSLVVELTLWDSRLVAARRALV